MRVLLVEDSARLNAAEAIVSSLRAKRAWAVETSSRLVVASVTAWLEAIRESLQWRLLVSLCLGVGLGLAAYPFMRDSIIDIGPIGRGRRVSCAARGLLTLVCAAQVVACAHFQPKPLSAAASIAGFDSRSLEAPGLRDFLAASHVAAPARGAAWSLKALTLTALYYQPALAEAREKLLAAQAAQITAGERPNPSIAVTAGYDAGVPGAVHPWIVPVSFDWPVETAGKRGYRLAEAQHLAAAARWNLVGTVWRVRNRLRAALLELYAARRSESLLAREESTRRNVVRLLEDQLRAGNVSSYEVAQARIAMDRVTLARQAAAGQLRQSRIALAGALGVPLRALDGARFSFADLKAFPLELTRPQVRQRALLDRADVRAALERYAASQSALQLQIARQWPDIRLGPGFTWNEQLAGDREWELGLSLPLPVLNHNQGPIAEAQAQRALAAAHFLTVQTAAVTQIDSSLAAYESARAQLLTADSLLRDLERQLSSVNAQVAAGELQPLDRVNARLAHEAGARNRLDALVRAQQALGRLEDAMQSPLTVAPTTVHAVRHATNMGTTEP
jgi:outer membrane protein, heavy metal efflux system